MRIRVLILEDNESDAELMIRALERSGMLPEWERVGTESDFTARLAPPPDLILSDYALPQFSGLQALRLVRSRGLDVPFIVVSGSIGEDIAVAALHEGADDYLLKDRMARLGAAVLQALERRRLRKEREQTEAARKASEGLYRGIFEDATEGILLSTLDGYLLAANPAAARMLGYASPEELQSSVTNPGHRLYADAGARRTLLERLERAGEVHGYETRGVRKDGKPLWVSVSARLMRDERGEMSQVLTMVSDISERKRADEVRASLAAIVENSNDAIIGRSLDGTITSWNAGAERLLGYSAAEAIGRPIAFVLPPSHHVRTLEISEKVLRGEALPPHETRRMTKDGRVIDVMSSVSPLRDSDGKVVGASQILHDITALKQAEAAMKESEERFRAVFEQAGVGMALRGIEPRQSRWLRVNQKLCDILGYTQDELLQLDSVEITPPEDRDLAIAYNEKLFSGEITSYSREKRYLRKDGRIIWANISLTAVTGPDERRSHVISVIEDITGRKEAENRIARLSRVRAVTSEINSAVVRNHDRQALLKETCRIAVEHGKFRMIWIGMLDRATLSVLPVAWAGFDDEFMHELRVSIQDDGPGGQGTTPRAVRGKQAAWDNDFVANPDVGYVRRHAIERGVRSAISLPLVIEGDVEGVFSLYADEPGFFTDDEIRPLEELASNVALALERMAQQQKIEKLSRIRAVSTEINAAVARIREREALLREACRIATEHGKFELVWVALVDQDKHQLKPVAWTGFSPETAQAVNWASLSAPGVTLSEVMRTRRLAVRNDIETEQPTGILRQVAVNRGFGSTVCLPFVVDGEVVSAMILFAAGRNFFIDDELALLNEAAGDISYALENIARQAKIDRLSRVRNILGEINAAIVRVRNAQELFEEACRIAVEQGRLGSAWIGVLDPATLDIVPVAWTGEGSEEMYRVKSTARDDPPQGQGAVSRAVRERRVVFNNDLSVQSFGGPRLRAVLKLGFRSIAALPLYEGEAVAGALTLYAKEPGFFDDEEIKVLTEVAGNISFTLEHIARQRKIEKLSRVRAVSGAIAAAIVRIRDRKELFHEACRIAVEDGKFVMAWIGMLDDTSQAIEPVAKAGREEGYLRRINLTIDRNITTNLALAAETVALCAPVVCNDIANDGRMRPWREAALERGYRAIAMLPLLVGRQAVGVFALYAPESGFFDEEEVRLLVEMSGDISFALDHIAREQKLDYLYYYDALTGLPNRTLFIDRAGQQMRTRGSEPLMVALVLLNLERFRYINEALGRNGGDELLKQVAQRLDDAFRGKDYLARIGADGFGIVMRGVRDAESVAHAIENQILGCFRDPYKLGDDELRVSAKAGIAMFPTDGKDSDTLFRNAEAALKKARDSGERYLFYAADMNARAAHALSLETRLRKAVEARQFVLHYQPKIDLANDSICGLEALIRWQEPGAGLVPPGSFIPLLEETGLILEVGRWAIGQALTDYRNWTAGGCAVPRIAVNVSAIQLQQRDFAEVVTGVMQQESGDPASLELEITESLLMKDVQASISKLSILQKLGIHIAMDDFGTGYSSLSYLARLP
ncbi:MAG: hypothetical protein A3I02_03940, partial [Betaproteobacteria bacterium RIFCSPLOWO2_02_FULL_67_26]